MTTYYKIEYYETYTRSRTSGEEEEVVGSHHQIPFDLDALQKAMDIIEIAGLKYWEVFEGKQAEEGRWIDYDREPILISKALRDHRDREERERDQFQEDQRARAAAINKLPERFELNTGTKFDDIYFIKRTEYSFRVGYSKGLQGGLRYGDKRKPEEKFVNFDHANYKTRGRAWQTKRFIEDHFDKKKITPAEAKKILMLLESAFDRVRYEIDDIKDSI